MKAHQRLVNTIVCVNARAHAQNDLHAYDLIMNVSHHSPDCNRTTVCFVLSDAGLDIFDHRMGTPASEFHEIMAKVIEKPTLREWCLCPSGARALGVWFIITFVFALVRGYP